jgi:hypothetical protein
MIPGVPEFARAQVAAFFAPSPRPAHGLPQGESSPRPAVAGGQHPEVISARPLNSRPSRRDDIAAFCGVAQMEEHRPVKPAVAGSNPAATAISKGLAPASTRVSKTCGARVGTSGARSFAARVLDAGEGR